MERKAVSDEHCIERLDVSVYTIPTDAPEADGTLAWNSTSVVVVEPHTRGGTTGLGYTFGDTATGTLIRGDAGDFLGQYRRNSHVALALRYSF